jgi:AraC-like DNA-binding protein
VATTTVGFQSVIPQEVYPSKFHPSSYWFDPENGRILQEYQIIYVTKGEGYFTSIHIEKTIVQEGTVLILYPNEWHTYLPKEETGWNAYWIGFKGMFAENIIQKGFFKREEPIINIGFNEHLINLFLTAIQLAQFQKTGFQQLVSSIALHMLGLIHYTHKNFSFEDDIVVENINKARLMMREGYDKDLSSEAIASSLNMSYSWFRKIFKRYTGLSPNQYQMQVKFQKAKELLASSNMQIKEIAAFLNFESESYFITFFKQKANVTPAHYRSMCMASKKS